MAGWQDGAEYAPIERPEAFAAPVVEALAVAEPYAADTPGAVRPPQMIQPPASAIPLEQLVPAAAKAGRDPLSPFSVASATLMPDSAWGAAHRAGEPSWAPDFDPTRPLGRAENGFPPPSTEPLGAGGAEPSWPAPASWPAPPPASLPGSQPGPWPASNTRPTAAGPGQFLPPSPRPNQMQAPPSSGLTNAQRQLLGVATGLLVLGCLISQVSWFAVIFASALTIRALPTHPGTRWLFVPPLAVLALRILAPETSASLNWALCLIYLIGIPLFFVLSSDRNR